MLKVVKFGGSSVADSNQFRKIKNIILEDESRRLVVVSAGGKRSNDDNKITDLLYLCYAHIKYSISCDSLFSTIEDRYRDIKKELNLNTDLESEFEIIRKNLKKGISKGYLISRGEYLTAKLMADYLGYEFIDSADIVIFDFNGKINKEKTNEAVKEYLEKFPRAVIPGFYGALPNKEIQLFSRGGSDITGSLIANAVNADIYENWTDVSGILVTDPRIVENPEQISILTYTELRELAYMGANVIHPDAVSPIKESNIPLNIRNTNIPENPGTIIVNNNSSLLKKYSEKVVTGIAGKKDFSILSIVKDHNSKDSVSIKKALEIFERYRINIEHITTGIDGFSLILNSEDIQKNIYEVIDILKNEIGTPEIKYVNEISLIAVVGRNMAKTPGIAGAVLTAVGNIGVNARMICLSKQS